METRRPIRPGRDPLVDGRHTSGQLAGNGEEGLIAIGEVAGPFNVLIPEDPGIDPSYISQDYRWLSSDAARYGTDTVLPVDTGQTAK